MSDPLKQLPTLILTLNSVEVSQKINDNTFPVGSGPLSVYYYLQSNTFMIQVNNCSYMLSKDYPISAIPSQHGQLYPSYSFPTNESSFIVRATDPTSSEAISSFKSILNKNSHLSYQEKPEVAFAKHKYPQLDEPNLKNEPMIQLETKSGQTNPEKPPYLVTLGGEFTRLGLIWSAGLLAKGFAMLGGYVESKSSKLEEKEVEPSVIENLSTADSATQTAANFTKEQSKVLLGAGKRWGEKIMDSELGHKFEQSKYRDSMVTIGRSSMYLGACLYDGFVEAISVLGKGIRDTTTSAVSHRYGEKVGDATKQGFNVIGNIGSIVTVYKDEANEYIQEQNGTVPEQNRANYGTKTKSD